MLVFQKPADVTYSEMAQYIDEHIYVGDDDQLCYEYLILIYFMLAQKYRYFYYQRDYEDFALYGANKLFLRYKGLTARSKDLPKIKSSMNYIKRIIYPMKVDYQQESFNKITDSDTASEEELQGIRDKMLEKGYASSVTNLKAEFEHYITTIPQTVKHAIKDIPYKNDKVMMHNIYISCMLTLLSSMTLSNVNKKKLDKKVQRGSQVDDLINTMYTEESNVDPILYHLDKSLGNYISTLTNKIKAELATDLQDVIGMNQPSDDIVMRVMMSPKAEETDE